MSSSFLLSPSGGPMAGATGALLSPLVPLAGKLGQQTEDAAAAQQQQDLAQARAEEIKAGAQISSDTMNAGRTLSAVAARAGGSGITAGSANPTLSEDYQAAKIRAAYTRFGGRLAASEDVYAGKLARYQGDQGVMANYFSIFLPILGSAAGIGKNFIGTGGTPPTPGPGATNTNLQTPSVASSASNQASQAALTAAMSLFA